MLSLPLRAFPTRRCTHPPAQPLIAHSCFVVHPPAERAHCAAHAAPRLLAACLAAQAIWRDGHHAVTVLSIQHAGGRRVGAAAAAAASWRVLPAALPRADRFVHNLRTGDGQLPVGSCCLLPLTAQPHRQLRVAHQFKLSASATMLHDAAPPTCSTGSANAPVLPLPVSAAAMMSPPPKMRGTHSAWMGVGSLHVQQTNKAAHSEKAGFGRNTARLGNGPAAPHAHPRSSITAL